MPERSPHPPAVGQSYGGFLHLKGGGNKVIGAIQPHVPAPHPGRRAPDSAVSILPSRKIQRHRRPTLEKKGATRVAPPTRGYRGDLQTMGNTRNRSIRLGRVHSGQNLCIARLQRSIDSIYRCLQSGMGLQPRLAVSSAQLNSTGTSAPEQVPGPVPTSSSQVGEDFLATGSSQQECRTSYDDQESREGTDRPDNRQPTSTGRAAYSAGVEDWVWKSATKDWKPQERDLIKSSWRTSTLSTYRAPLNRWITWCQKNNLDPGSPRGSDLAKFLASLHLEEGLAYSTILVHKSAIATFCSGGQSMDLSADFLVRQALKAISTARPRKIKASVWDTGLLFKWLTAEIPGLTLFEVARRTATILLLASGRHIHDLTLLRISKEHVTNLGKEIILWPAFRPKTDRASFRKSGWRLSKNSNIRICPVTWTRTWIELSEKRREGSNLEELFITLTGPVRAASQTVISGWIRSVLKDAGIDASPGSIRAAVAFRGWIDDMPVQEILDRGNWKCSETFARHYCRQVTREEEAPAISLASNFKPT
ncbi:uncharacterized protein LOC123261437 [Cotesia glomerata]|uniref:uncharacterized protein LOC123261437 n=1 Tax=Cotesia glomerata TaxID=32391 RepID=UPI001D031140|nr:uncharacterized protein LOC123261437 [Cotesia glomerata]